MKRRIILSTFISVAYAMGLFGQDFAVTKTNDTIFGKVNKIEPDKVKMTVEGNGKKMVSSSEDVVMVYLEGEDSYYKSKLIPGKKQKVWFLKEIIGGNISVYLHTFNIVTGSGMSGYEYYFLQKEAGELIRIPDDILMSSEAKRTILLDLMSDDSSCIHSLDTLTMNSKNIGGIIKKYNKAK